MTTPSQPSWISAVVPSTNNLHDPGPFIDAVVHQVMSVHELAQPGPFPTSAPRRGSSTSEKIRHFMPLESGDKANLSLAGADPLHR